MSNPSTVNAASVAPVEMVPGVFRRTLAYGEHGMLIEKIDKVNRRSLN